MKIVLVTFFLITINLYSKSQAYYDNGQPYYDKERIVRNKIKHVISYKDGVKNLDEKYDKSGNLVEKKIYGRNLFSGDTTLVYSWTLRYFENGKLAECIREDFETDHTKRGKIRRRDITVCDSSGRKISEKLGYPGQNDKYDERISIYNDLGQKINMEYRSSNHIGYYTFKCDDKGNCLEELELRSSLIGDGDKSFKKIFKYNNNGQEIEARCYHDDNSGELYNLQTKKYDFKGNKIEENEYYIAEAEQDAEEQDAEEYEYPINQINYYSLTTKTTFKYDNNGNKIEEIDYDPSDELYSLDTMKYDSIGNLIIGKIKIPETDQDEIYDRGETVVSKHEITYDKDGDPIEIKYYNLQTGVTEIETFEYEFYE